VAAAPGVLPEPLIAVRRTAARRGDQPEEDADPGR